MGLALAFLPLAIAQPVSLAIFRVLLVLWTWVHVYIVVQVCIPPLPHQHARAAERALPMQPKTLSAWLDPLQTL